jgi:hypothetical protein
VALKDSLIIITGVFTLLAATQLNLVVRLLIGVAVLGSSSSHSGSGVVCTNIPAKAEPVRSPSTMPPPSPEMLLAAAEESIWGQDRCRARSEWNGTERRAYLWLERRDVEVQASRAR